MLQIQAAKMASVSLFTVYIFLFIHMQDFYKSYS